MHKCCRAITLISATPHFKDFGLLEVNGPNQDVSDRVNALREERIRLETEVAVQQDNMRTRATFIHQPERIIANAVDKKTYLESKDQHTVKELMKLFIRKLPIVDQEVTIEYQIPVPDEEGTPIWPERSS